MARVSLLPLSLGKKPKVFMLPHPRTDENVPFILSKNYLYEVFDVGTKSHSFFVNNQVISRGELILAVQFHPILVALPLFMTRGNEYYNMETYFKATNYEVIADLLIIYMVKFGDISMFYDQIYWAYIESKMMDFLDRKFKSICQYIDTKGIFPDYIIRQKAFDIFRHYLPLKFASKFYFRMNESRVETFSPALIKTTQPVDFQTPTSSPQHKPRKKRTPKVLKGVKEITAYFSPIKSK
ncbi:hypothetical protein TRFO_39492 [Tritrichomonas foetus]|uniref:Rnh202 triple barrel domain-containing protein n=1 Tax=Tritrichomonas foetus TaxID=1144522 RepID=A0A1J4J4N2_9EUKA|nr:hypothetical protein TRFO_39492 [Tritrichomonas foetus]|eukprot:OHS94302.1 hypothetical protein TRFO_39492 [Tritrichomonas foetus]